MKPRHALRARGLLCLLCLLAAAAACLSRADSVSAWFGRPDRSTPICTAPGDQLYLCLVPDGSGGAIIAWQDQRSDNGDIYAQKVDSGGAVQWAPGGVALCTAAGSQSGPRAVSDGSGGATIAWQDQRSGNTDIYAQRVDSGGAVQWTAGGVPLCAAAGDQSYPEIIPDGSGGAVVAWHDMRSGETDIYAQRVTSGGAVQWTAGGAPLCTAPGNQVLPQIAPGGPGEAIVTWYDYRSGSTDIYAQALDGSGAARWTAGGVPVCTAPGGQVLPQLVSDGSGGAIIVWTDYRSANYDLYAQALDGSGVARWTAGGVPVCAAPGGQVLPQVVSDGSGGAIIAWYDYRSGGTDIYAQALDGGGNTQWTADGTPVCAASFSQYAPQLAPDGNGGAIIAWPVYRGDSYDIYVQRVDSGGAARWTAGGVPVCTAAGNQDGPRIASDGLSGAIIAWHDYRGGSTADVYADRVTAVGALPDTEPPSVTLVSMSASPTKLLPVPVTATFSEAVIGFTIDDLQVTNGTASAFAAVSGMVYSFEVFPAGQGPVTVDIAAGAASDAALHGCTAARLSFTYDTVPPSVTLVSTASGQEASPIPLTATFSENVTGFDIDDIVTENGTASNLVPAGPAAFTFDVTPAREGPVMVRLPAGAALDAAGNGSSEASFSTTYAPAPGESPSGSFNWWMVVGIGAGAAVLLGAAAGWAVPALRKRGPRGDGEGGV